MDILIRKEGAILTLAFNRPQRKNAITAAMYQALAGALAEADRDDTVKVVLIHGTDDAFTAGNDLEDFLQDPPQREDSPVFLFLHQISRARKPLVAAVNGVAVGIGTTLLLHCDLVFIGDKAKFALPFTALGQPFGAQQAVEMGFVNRVLPPAEVLPAAHKAAEQLAALPGKSLRATKALLRGAFQATMESRMAEESRLFKEMLTEPAAKEAFAAFFEKRKPDFSGLD